MADDKDKTTDQLDNQPADDLESASFIDESGKIVDIHGNPVEDNPAAMKRLRETTEKLTQTIAKVLPTVNTDAISDTFKKINKQVTESLLPLFSSAELLQTWQYIAQRYYDRQMQRYDELTDEEKAKLQELKKDIDHLQQDMQAALEEGTSVLDTINELKPYLLKELEKPEYKGAAIDDLLDQVDPQSIVKDLPQESMLAKAIHAARVAQAKDLQIQPKHVKHAPYPVDKVNNEIWKLFDKQPEKQLALYIDLASSTDQDKGLQVRGTYSIDFSILGENTDIVKKLTPFDKLVFIGANALYNAGNEYYTSTQVHYAMGNTKRPAQSQLAKIDKILSKLNAEITLDNSEEADRYNYNHFQYKGALLPTERITGEVRGKHTESIIHQFRESALITFAKERDQLTTIPIEALQVPLSQTEKNLAILDYLIERISRERRSASKTKKEAKRGTAESSATSFTFSIMLDTFYKNTGTTKGYDKTRAPQKITAILDHYKSIHWITSFEITKDRIIITAPITYHKTIPLE